MDINERLAAVETEQKNIFHQLDELKNDVKGIHRLTTSVEKIAVQMDSTSRKVDKIDRRLEEIEQEPGETLKHYKRVIVGCIITGVIGVIIGALFALVIK